MRFIAVNQLNAAKIKVDYDTKWRNRKKFVSL
jgi:hypothetical protein